MSKKKDREAPKDTQEATADNVEAKLEPRPFAKLANDWDKFRNDEELAAEESADFKRARLAVEHEIGGRLAAQGTNARQGVGRAEGGTVSERRREIMDALDKFDRAKEARNNADMAVAEASFKQRDAEMDLRIAKSALMELVGL